jgi:hypothetical protein
MMMLMTRLHEGMEGADKRYDDRARTAADSICAPVLNALGRVPILQFTPVCKMAFYVTFYVRACSYKTPPHFVK